jgi:hypothetical protein
MRENRTRILIDRFQSRLYLRIVVYWLIAAVSLWNFLFVWCLLKEGRGDPLDQFGRFCLDFYPVLLCFAIVVPFFAWDAVKFSHRLVGPVVRFRKVLQAIAEGKPVSTFQLRKGDFLVELKDDLNAVITALHERGVLQPAPAGQRASEPAASQVEAPNINVIPENA